MVLDLFFSSIHVPIEILGQPYPRAELPMHVPCNVAVGAVIVYLLDVSSVSIEW